MKFLPEHIGLAAMNPTALKDWYERVLGAELICQLDKTPPAFMLSLPGGFWIEIYQADFAQADTAQNKLRGWRHLAFRVESIEAARSELIREHVEIGEPIKPAGGGGRVLFFRDCEDNLIHLVERATGEGQVQLKNG